MRCISGRAYLSLVIDGGRRNFQHALCAVPAALPLSPRPLSLSLPALLVRRRDRLVNGGILESSRGPRPPLSSESTRRDATRRDARLERNRSGISAAPITDVALIPSVNVAAKVDRQVARK